MKDNLSNSEFESPRLSIIIHSTIQHKTRHIFHISITRQNIYLRNIKNQLNKLQKKTDK